MAQATPSAGVARAGLMAWMLAASACGEGELPGIYFDVDVRGTADECNEPDVEFEESYTYRVVLDGSAAQVFVDEALLATGFVQGCEFLYTSPTFTTEDDEGTVRWTIDGEATIAVQEGCDAGEGWSGVERLRISASTDDEVDPGCVVTTSVEGVRTGEVR